jgi:hypothetical protein
VEGHPEGFQLDSNIGRAFVNVPDAHEIAVLDTNAGRQKAIWRTGDLRANFPMAFDGSRATVAVVFRDPPRLVVFDANSGRSVSELVSCRDADDVFFDQKRRRIYVSCGEGVVDVWKQDADGYRQLDPLKTSSGARTSLFVPELDRLFVAARAGFFGLGSDASLLVIRPTD